MNFSIRHAMPGRLRLNIPELCRKPSLAEAVLSWLGAQSGVRTARINYDCASLVLEYDPAQETTLRLMLERFRSATSGQIKALASSATAGVATTTAQPPPVSKKMPLALPTLSLAMAFSANPVVFAANMPLMLWNAWPIAKRAWKVWENESRLNIDVLDTLAISASVLQGNPLAGCIVTWLIKLGDWIRDLTAAGSKRAISELLEFQTKSAWIVRDGEVVSIPAAELAEGDLVVVYPGEMIPVDGEITDGPPPSIRRPSPAKACRSAVGSGEAAFAATVIREGQITIRALRVGIGDHRRPDRAPGRSPRRSATPASRTMPSALPTGW